MRAAKPFSGRVLIAVLLAANLCPAGRVAAAVFGSDERKPLARSEAGLTKSIGYLGTPAAGPFCTAFCVAPDIIATASHCLFGTRAEPRADLSDITFKTVDGNQGLQTAIAGGAIANQRQNIVSGTVALDTAPPIDAHNDWALVRLARPACAANALRLASTLPSIGSAAAANVAYHRDIPETRLSIARQCKPQTIPAAGRGANVVRDFAAPRNLLFHTCDTGGGSSGSPMLRHTQTGLEVTAINVGTYVIAKALVSAGGNQQTTGSAAVANTAILSSVLTAPLATLAARDLIDSQRDILALSRALRARGFYRGAIGPHVTAPLIDAVKDYERAKGLPETGLLSKALKDRLLNAPAAQAQKN